VLGGPEIPNIVQACLQLAKKQGGGGADAYRRSLSPASGELFQGMVSSLPRAVDGWDGPDMVVRDREASRVGSEIVWGVLLADDVFRAGKSGKWKVKE
jgi:hypothetical protein